MKNLLFLLFLCFITIFKGTNFYAQELDIDEVLERLDRIEKNISDLQKGKIGNLEKSISSGYISRTESRLDEIETKNRLNYGIIEEIQNKINNIDDKLNLLNTEFQSRISDIEKKLESIRKNEVPEQKVLRQIENNTSSNLEEKKEISTEKLITENQEKDLSDAEIKKKYENAIKLLWGSKYENAQNELEILKRLNPKDLMPNIQYWLGEVHYAQRNFEQAIIEFGEGLKNYPESIKGPDNLLKLGLSFSNLKKKNEACNVLYELEVKYKDAPKNVLERAASEIKKLDCPKE